MQDNMPNPYIVYYLKKETGNKVYAFIHSEEIFAKHIKEIVNRNLKFDEFKVINLENGNSIGDLTND